MMFVQSKYAWLNGNPIKLYVDLRSRSSLLLRESHMKRTREYVQISFATCNETREWDRSLLLQAIFVRPRVFLLPDYACVSGRRDYSAVSHVCDILNIWSWIMLFCKCSVVIRSCDVWCPCNPVRVRRYNAWRLDGKVKTSSARKTSEVSVIITAAVRYSTLLSCDQRL